MKTLFLSLFFSLVIFGQVTNIPTNVQLKNLPGLINTNYSSTAQFKTGTSIPGTCTPAANLAFYKTDTKVWYDCTDTNTYTLRSPVVSSTGVMLSGVVDPGAPTITVVNSNIVQSGSSTLTVVSGDVLIAVMGSSGNGSGVPATMSDTQGNVWTLDVYGYYAGFNTNYSAIAHCVAKASGSTTFSWTPPSGSTNQGTAVLDVNGIQAVTDYTNQVNNSGITPSQTLTATAYDFVVSGLWWEATAPATAGTGMTTIIQTTGGSNKYFAVGYGIAPSTGSYTQAFGEAHNYFTDMAVSFNAVPVVGSPGSNGDWYLNLTTGKLWNKSSNTWALSGWHYTHD